MPETVPISEARAQLSQLVDRVVAEHERFIVTRHGKPVAVLLSPEELGSLEETLEILQDQDLVASLRESRRAAAEGKRDRLTPTRKRPSR